MPVAFQLNAFQTQFPLVAFQSGGQLIKVNVVGVDSIEVIPVIEQGGVVELFSKVVLLAANPNTPYTPEQVVITVKMPDGNFFVVESPMMYAGVTGMFSTVIVTSSSSPVGPWVVWVKATDGIYSDVTLPQVAFTVK